MTWVVAGGAAVLMIAFMWFLTYNMRHLGGKRAGGTLAVFDEVFAPNRYQAMLEVERQQEVPAPAPVPGDGDDDIYSGKIRLRLPH